MYPQPQYANFYPAAIGVDNEEFPVDHQVYMNQVPIPEQIAAETMHFRNSRIVDSSTGEQLESFHAQNAPSSYALPYTEANNSFAMHSSKMPTNNVNRNMSMLPATPANQGPVALLKDEYHDEKSLDRQRFCFCFRRRWQCVSFFAFLLITIGVLIYLSIPGLPNFTVSDPYIPVGGAGLQIVQNPAAVTLNINEDYSVYSPSYFTWAIRQLKVDLTLKNTNGQLIPEARGFSTLQDLRFVGRSTTNFTVVSFFVNLSRCCYDMSYLTGLIPTQTQLSRFLLDARPIPQKRSARRLKLPLIFLLYHGLELNLVFSTTLLKSVQRVFKQSFPLSKRLPLRNIVSLFIKISCL